MWRTNAPYQIAELSLFRVVSVQKVIYSDGILVGNIEIFYRVISEAVEY